MRFLPILCALFTLSACSHVPRLVWEERAPQTNKAAMQMDLTQQTPLQMQVEQKQQALQNTTNMINLSQMAGGDSVALFPLDGPVPNPFANRYPGQGNGYVARTTTDGGYPVRDPSVVVFPLDDPQTQLSPLGQPTKIIVPNNAPTSLTRANNPAMPVVMLQPPVSAQAPLLTPFQADGSLAPNISPPQPAEIAAAQQPRRRTMLTGY